MSSDSDIDFEKYMPSPEVMREIADPKLAEARLREAFADPELRAMMAAEGRSPEVTPVPPAPLLPAPAPPPLSGSGAASAARTNAASPWAKEAPPVVVDAAALPSANAPAANRPHTAKKSASPRVAWSPAAKGIAAIVFAFLPAILVIVLFVRPGQQSMQASSAAPTVATIAPAVNTMTMPSVEPAKSASAEPPTAPVKSAEPPAAPVKSAEPVSVPPKPKASGAVEDPYDAAPTPTPTVTPTASPSATVAPSAPAPAPEPTIKPIF